MKLQWTTEQRRPNDLIPLTINPRKITEEKRQKLIESLEKFNLVEIPAINLDGTIIAGHQRITSLQIVGRGNELIDVRVPNRLLTETEVKEYNLLSNTHSGEFDFEVLDTFFADIDMEALGVEITPPADIEPAPVVINEADDIEDMEQYAEQLKTDIVIGDLFQIGAHRLMCGDSTIADNVVKLLDGGGVNIMVTDPPYGVNYIPNWRNDYCMKHGIGVPNKATGVVENDLQIDWTDAYSLFAGDVAYVWHAGKYTDIVLKNLKDLNFQPISQIIWAKQHFVFSRGDYHWKHEPCWYVVRKGKNHNWAGDRKQTTVWDILNNNSFGNSNKEESTGHGTQKPIECMARPIRNHEGDVYDPFLGSGTTMVAAHQLNRKCYGIEISPNYCQVIINRMQKLFPGIEVKKLN